MAATALHQPLHYSPPSLQLPNTKKTHLTSTASSSSHKATSPPHKLHSHLSLPPTATPSTSFKTKSTQPPNEHPNILHSDALASALQRCAAAPSVREGTQIHALILHLGLSRDLYLSSQLLFFYCSCGLVDAARSIFDATPQSRLNLFFWNIMIRAYTDSGRYREAIEFFSYMVCSGFLPNRFTFPFVLKSCTSLRCLHFGRGVHGMMVVMGFQHDVFAASALLDFYSKCGCLGDARQLFDRVPQRSLVTWNAMILAYAQNGFWVEALRVLDGVGDEVEVSSWNSLIAGCVNYGDGGLALEMLGRMLGSGPFSVKPNLATFNTLLPVIPTISSLAWLKEFHGFVIRWQGVIVMESVDDERLKSTITAGYAHHGFMVYSARLFDGILLKTSHLWNSMISGFIDSRQTDEAFRLFRKMAVQKNNSEFETFSKVSLTLLLPECAPSSLTGLEIHGHAYRRGLECDTSVNNALIAMYARRGDLELSNRVFERIPEKDVISWNTMVSCYARDHDYDRAFSLFSQMHSHDVKPDEFTFSSILNGCGHSVALQQGMGIHGYMIKSGYSEDYYCVVQNALLDMYGKCGCVEEAEMVFDEMTYRDNVSWNTIISCCSINARASEAFLHFQEMQEHGWKPNHITFVALLSACGRAGLVGEVLHCFQNMTSKHGVTPDLEHYGCIVDSLGRAGLLDEAYQLIESMPIVPDHCIWGALLSGCRIHGNVHLAEVAASHLVELEPQHSGYRVLLSNIYADAQRWDDVARVRAGMKNEGVTKCPGCSWVDVGGVFHTFFTADKTHIQSRTIYLTLDGLTKQLDVEGYVPLKDPEFFSFNQDN
ncbi:hypothetical protein MRB53_013730 [Persea americana]|uniref:Uncharacterized protein n=1 Tax=Persea americana TaxID=3435 RepID=A0ACC2K8T2_PERAE|nr:hypothetical protein MRB53_013730 [Persea americana]